MKKQEKEKNTKTPVRKEKKGETQESWRRWVLTTVALGFALLVITLLSKENRMLSEKVENASAQQKVEEKNIVAPLSYSLESTPGVKAVVSQEAFDARSASDLLASAQECGTNKTQKYFDELMSEFAGVEQVVYSFVYPTPSQDGNYTVTVVPNAPEYENLEQFKQDFNICAAGASMYPMAMSEDWLMFTNSCGTGLDDGSGKPYGCVEMQEKIEPTLRLN